MTDPADILANARELTGEGAFERERERWADWLREALGESDYDDVDVIALACAQITEHFGLATREARDAAGNVMHAAIAEALVDLRAKLAANAEQKIERAADRLQRALDKRFDQLRDELIERQKNDRLKSAQFERTIIRRTEVP
jgi:hypothetical protein